MGEPALVIPMKLDAFVFNQSACDGTDSTKAKIAPISQPNYTFLRMKNYMVQHDVLDPVDLHNSAPSTRNPRYTDVGQNSPRQNRIGVYLHWMVPKPFRAGSAATDSAKAKHTEKLQARGIQGQFDENADNLDHKTPIFPIIPNRWLVIRTLDPDAPTTVPKGTKIERIKAWVVESDKTYSIDELDLKVDLQVDVAPFLTTFVRKNTKPEDIKVDEQAEVFIGACTEANLWKKKDQDPKNSRVEITAASSSNQLFMDFQYHCSNVFSMVDTFEYDAANGKRHLEAAHANYYVLGWQSNTAHDLLNLPDPNSKDAITRRQRLDALSMNFTSESNPDNQTIKDWLASHKPTQSVLHGTIYDVEWSNKWDFSPNAPIKAPKNPADDFTKIFTSGKNIAVGTTPVDSILAHVTKHGKDDGVEKTLYKLDNYLRAEDESVSGQIVAADEVQNLHFAKLDGGEKYTLADTDFSNSAKRPTEDQLNLLRDINTYQIFLDSIARRVRQLRWDLFAVWWKYISDIDNAGHDHDEKYGRVANGLRDELTKLLNTWIETNKLVNDAKTQTNHFITPPKKAIEGSFYQQNDPTLLIAGLTNPWPRDFKEKLAVRLESQIAFTTPPDKDILEQYHVDVILIPSIQRAALKLVKEFLALNKTQDLPSNTVPPLYHDHVYEDDKEVDNYWRDRWSQRQAWFPLYIEWEAEYFHIPFEEWALTQRSARNQESVGRISYNLIRDLPSKSASDRRVLSGRTLILPQPGFSLQIRLERLFKIINEKELKDELDRTGRKKILAEFEKLGYLSSPLGGLQDHLTTRFNGTHVKPLVRVPGHLPVPLADARAAAAKIGMDEKMLGLIDAESTTTPYGALVSLPDKDHNPFKPVTHGQMRFTKLNVVDKFGQVAHATDPLVDKSPPIILAVGEYYKTALNEAGTQPNVVDPSRSDKDNGEFIQLPPMINQPARLNAEFMMPPSQEGGDWTVANAWEAPIWGWVVINYPDHGLQFFLENGTFYREVRLTQGEQSSEKWLPFSPPDKATSDHSQLDWLIRKMTDKDNGQTYLKEFMRMVMNSMARLIETPDAYGQFMNALVGRPLALTYIGCFLELAGLSRGKETILAEKRTDIPAEMGLLADDGPRRYAFPVKFGDKERLHDGLVGYFDWRTEDKRKKEGPGDNLELSKCYTYYENPAGSTAGSQTVGSQLLTPIYGNYRRFQAHWVDPEKFTNGPAKEAAQKFERTRYSYFEKFGAVMDPFLPINFYSSILPIKSLKLPTWTWESAFKKMTTFFHAGPVIVTNDVPAFDPKRKLDDNYNLRTAQSGPGISIPALQIADWNWLQPYSIVEKKEMSQDDPRLESEEVGTVFMPLGVKKLDDRPAFQRGPYTAIEGYMQLKGPIERNVKAKKP